MTVEIDNEINVIHKFIRDKYLKRFPELESLVPNALDYIRTVRELGNHVERAKNNEVLQKFLTTATIMVVSVSASTTQGNWHILFEINGFAHRVVKEFNFLKKVIIGLIFT